MRRTRASRSATRRPALSEGAGARHGGDLGEARRLFPDAALPWLDLSTGINPVAYPLPPWPAEAFTRLPAPADHAALEAVAAAAYGVRTDEVVAAPGTQILISLLPRLLGPFPPRAEAAIVAPTYAEHALSWRSAGLAVAEVSSPEAARGAAVAVVVDPNNPDGRRADPETLAALAAACRARGGLLIVDEAFADLEEPGGLGARRPPGAVVLRSFGKAYGLAGLRLGFLIGDRPAAARVRAALGPWAVSGPAIHAGRAALADAAWRAATARARGRDAARLDALLAHVGGSLVGGTRLFRTWDFPDAAGLADQLGWAGIWVRRFPEAPARLRFGLPGSEADWDRLETAIA